MVLRFKLWFPGFDSTRFHIFLFLGICSFFAFSSFFKLSHYWQFTYHIIIGIDKNTNEQFEILKYIEYGFNDFDATFLKILV